MYKYILESVDNVNWLTIGPLILFFIFFCGILIRTWLIKKSHVEKMANMPLDD